MTSPSNFLSNNWTRSIQECAQQLEESPFVSNSFRILLNEASTPMKALNGLEFGLQCSLVKCDPQALKEITQRYRNHFSPRYFIELHRRWKEVQALPRLWSAVRAIDPDYFERPAKQLVEFFRAHKRLDDKEPVFAHVTHIDLSSAGLESIPEELSQFPALTSLNLSFNPLQDVSGLKGLRHLRVINLEGAAIHPSAIEKVALRMLWMKLKEQRGDLLELSDPDAIRDAFPVFAEEIASIERLSLSNQGLRVLPPEICFLTGMTSLDLSGNHLTELPPHFKLLRKLQYLDLSGNPLTEETRKRVMALNLKVVNGLTMPQRAERKETKQQLEEENAFMRKVAALDLPVIDSPRIPRRTQAASSICLIQ